MRRAELVLHHNPAPRADVMLMKTVEEAHGPPSPKKKTKQKKPVLSFTVREEGKGRSYAQYYARKSPHAAWKNQPNISNTRKKPTF